MPPYAGKSFEELRVEDYRQGNKGRGGAASTSSPFGGGATFGGSTFGQKAAVGAAGSAKATTEGPGGGGPCTWPERPQAPPAEPYSNPLRLGAVPEVPPPPI